MRYATVNDAAGQQNKNSKQSFDEALANLPIEFLPHVPVYLPKEGIVAIKQLMREHMPERKPPMKVEVSKDSDDLSKMIWAKKRGYNKGIEDVKEGLGL